MGFERITWSQSSWLLLLFMPFNSSAYETVTINGTLYACQHACNVAMHRDGSFTISDNAGGWAAKIALNGELIHEEPL